MSDLESAGRKIQSAIIRMRNAVAEFNTELIACHREIQEALDEVTPVARTRSQMLAATRESTKKVGEILDRANKTLEKGPSKPPPKPR